MTGFACLLGFAVCSAATAQPRIEPFLELLPEATRSYVFAVNDEATVLAGTCIGPGSNARAFYWTVIGGIQDIGVLPGGTSAQALAMTRSGSLVAGISSTSIPFSTIGFIWSPGGTPQSLGVLPGGCTNAGCNSFPAAISDHGDAIAGFGGTTFSAGTRAFHWTGITGMVSLGVPSGHSMSSAYAISADGSVLAGFSVASDGNQRAFRWTMDGGFRELTGLPGRISTNAGFLSADGTVVAGSSTDSTTNGSRAVLWTSEGVEDLGLLPGAGSAFCTALRSDGAMAAGRCGVGDGSRPFIWIRSTGMVDLHDYLSAQGIDLSEWTLGGVRQFTRDGSILVGDGIYRGAPCPFVVKGIDGCQPLIVVQPSDVTACRGGEARFQVQVESEGIASFKWRRDGAPLDTAQFPSAASPTLVLPRATQSDVGRFDCVVSNACGERFSAAAALSVCAADTNCDGFLDFFDYDDFVRAFEEGGQGADFNEDGFLDFFDYDGFVSTFELGC